MYMGGFLLYKINCLICSKKNLWLWVINFELKFTHCQQITQLSSSGPIMFCDIGIIYILYTYNTAIMS